MLPPRRRWLELRSRQCNTVLTLPACKIDQAARATQLHRQRQSCQRLNDNEPITEELPSAFSSLNAEHIGLRAHAWHSRCYL
jgi:hypothetical protein